MAKSNFIVRGGADFSGLYKGMNTAQKRMSGFQTGISKTLKGIGMVIGTLAIGKLVKDSLSAASSLEGAMLGLESIVVGQGKSFEKAKGFINDYIKDGLVPLTDAVTAYKNLASRGYDDEQIKTVMERLKDSAAFGRQGSLSLGEAVKSATEGLKNENSILVDNAGVTKNVSMMWKDYAKQLGKGVDSLTTAEKIQAEVNGITHETRYMVGNAAKYTDTYAGRLAALNKVLFDIKVNLGNAFIPIANVILPLLQSLGNSIKYVTSVFAAFSQALFGKATKVQAKATEAQATAVGDLGDATETAGKQAKGAMAGFDEINSLALDSGSSGEGALGSVGVVDTELEQVDDGTGGMMEGVATKADEMAEKMKKAFTNLKNVIVENKDVIVIALGAIAGALAGVVTFNGINSLIYSFKYLKIAVGLAWSTLLAHPLVAVVAAIGALVGAFITAYNTNDEFKAKVDKLWITIKTNLTPVIEALGSVLNWLWQNVLLPVGRVLVDVLKVAFEGVSYSAKTLWQYVLQPLGSFILAVFTPILTLLANVLSTVLKFAVDLLVKSFEFLWYSVLKPMTEWLNNTFRPAFEVVGDGIRTVIGGMQTTFEGLIKFITGVFTGNWKKAWEGVKTVFKGVFDTLYGFVKAPLNLIIKAVNKVINGLNKIKVDIPDWVSKITGVSGTWGINIPDIPALATGGITNGPTLAMVGDNPGGREVISPLNDLTNIIASAVGSAVMNAMQFSDNSSNNSGNEFILSIDGTKLGRIMLPKLNQESERLGYKAVLQPM